MNKENKGKAEEVSLPCRFIFSGLILL